MFTGGVVLMSSIAELREPVLTSFPSMKAVEPVKGCSCILAASSVISTPRILQPAMQISDLCEPI